MFRLLASKRRALLMICGDAFHTAPPGLRATRAASHLQHEQQHLWSFILSRSYAKNAKNRDEDDDDDFVDPRSKPNAPKGPRLNRAITDRLVRVVTPEGHQVVSRQEALNMAEKQGLDLVEVDPTNEPVVCKIMDYKKEKYKERLREKERKKTNLDSRRLSELKELQITSKIDDRDLEMKAENASRLIQRGHRLKCVVKLSNKPAKDDDEKSPVRADPKAIRLIEKLVDLLKDVSKLEQGPQSERHRAWAILRPLPPPKKGSAPKADATPPPPKSSPPQKSP